MKLSKFNSMGNEVELLEANLSYKFICVPNEREDAVALKYLTPKHVDVNLTKEEQFEKHVSVKEKTSEPADAEITEPIER